jgi:hypothetical protein
MGRIASGLNADPMQNTATFSFTGAGSDLSDGARGLAHQKES